jgi:2-keto-4-pentenoate hydratase
MDLQQLAARQLADYDRARPGTWFGSANPALSVAEAYEVQFRVARLREARGERVAGYKVGCVSRTMRQQLGLDRPVFGHVWESELRPSGCTLDPAGFDGLAVEGEFAVRAADDVPSADWLRRNPGVLATALAVVELHHYVFRGPPAERAAELVANNAIHAGVVLPGGEAAVPGADALTGVAVRVSRNGEVLGEATGAELEDGPLAGVVRLAEHLAGHGRRLLRGQLVLTGSPLPLWRVSAGDRVEVRCDAWGQVAAVRVGG